MTQWTTLILNTDSRGVARLTLNRPERHNAMNGQMIRDLTEAAACLGADPAVRVVVLTGAGDSFCAGADLDWIQGQLEGDPQTPLDEARRLAEMLEALNTLPKPLIGWINGQAYGGGLGLIAVCDLALADTRARFAFTETRLGLIPAAIAPHIVARMGAGGSRHLMMSARPFAAPEAVTLGLLAGHASTADLEARIAAEVDPYLDAAPGAVAATKALVRALGPQVDMRAQIDEAIRRQDETWDSDAARDGLAAFFARRPKTV
ncbi:MAG: enoyl-CoA hydratase-related protein [Qingshengfaniella sp.]